ncbi:hypothetical protein [Ruminococcus sp. Marseille-P6503]|uniref:hypothetical protein n=1 Tax=Ruminococcus sp. Marseille-P6503 TaxID=2364796 RepID=UPI000F524B92|nr:hypothetical protein [Ruminococcus sp. Marseille-P6503]
MYKKHKIISVIGFITVFTISCILHIVPIKMASDILTVTSIILGFYVTALSTLFENSVIKDMAKRQDTRIKSKTELGVLLSYYKSSIMISFAVIFTSILCILLDGVSNYTICHLQNIMLSIMLGLVFISLYLMMVLINLYINMIRLNTKDKKE